MVSEGSLAQEETPSREEVPTASIAAGLNSSLKILQRVGTDSKDFPELVNDELLRLGFLIIGAGETLKNNPEDISEIFGQIDRSVGEEVLPFYCQFESDREEMLKDLLSESVNQKTVMSGAWVTWKQRGRKVRDLLHEAESRISARTGYIFGKRGGPYLK